MKMKPRPEKIATITYEMKTGCGPLYIRITHQDNRPFEIFPELGKSTGCQNAQTETIGKLGSIMLRIGVDPAMIIFFLKGIQCDKTTGSRAKQILSCADAVAKCLERFLAEEAGRILTEEEKTREYWEAY